MERHQVFSTNLTAAPTYRVGEPINVTFELRNNATEPFQILAWDTPLEGSVTNYFEVRRDGELVEYNGPFVKRGDPSPESYAVIQPGQQIAQTVDISTSYPIDRPGQYTVTLNAILHDAFPIP